MGSNSAPAIVVNLVDSNDRLCVSAEQPPLKRSWSHMSIRSSVSNFLDRSWQKARSGSYMGLLLAITSGILFTFYSALLATIKQEININTVLCLRGIVQSVAMGLALWLWKIPATAKLQDLPTTTCISRLRRWSPYLILAIVTVIGGIRLSLLFQAFQLIPITSVHTIINASPVLVMLLSHFILNDSYNLLRVFSSMGFVLGVIFVFQPHQTATKLEMVRRVFFFLNPRLQIVNLKCWIAVLGHLTWILLGHVCLGLLCLGQRFDQENDGEV